MPRLVPTACAVFVVALASVSPASRAENPRVNTQVFRPSPHPGDLLGARTSDTAGGVVGGVSVFTTYGSQPLAFIDSTGRLPDHELIQDQLSLEVLAGLRFFEHFSVGLAIPVFLVNDGQDSGFLSPPFVAIPEQALADIRLSAKVGLLVREPGEDGLGLAVELLLGLPTATADAFVGDGLTFTPTVALDLRAGPVLLAANLGANLRGNAYFPFNTTIGHEFLWRFGASVDLRENALTALAEVYGASHNYSEENNTYIEGLLGARLPIGETGFAVTLGGGRGFTRGYGSTKFRVFGALSFATAPDRDQDGDGLIDDLDACPTVPEDVDGFQDADGCPEPDNDNDNVLDAADPCPLVPEDYDGHEDLDGCPEPDNDGDGLLDAADKCPDQAEDLDGFADDDGCPEADNDGDGIRDDADKCPAEAEDRDGYQDEDGCPEPDNDGDGILDIDDDCPSDATNRCGIVMNPCEIVISEQIFFESNKEIIKPESFAILDAVASVMLSREWIEELSVEGHTDAQGPDAYNLELSQRRSESVARYLAGKGVAATRLSAKGYGETKPLATNNTPAGRAKNRRVQFIIVRPSQQQCTEGTKPPGK